ncbi:MAG TPA: sulfurtransferase [Xanthomonadales bacterium]|nr:sulfurtransferase [Xanthomonadales bacterium]
MDERTLVSPERAAALIAAGEARAIDCRFDPVGPGCDPERGARDYAAGHVPGAVYANLDLDLSDLRIGGRGRHPLPSEAAFSATLSRWGLEPSDAVIAYDDASGAYASRLWWMLRLVGHARVAVLDGGFAAWRAAGLPLEAAVPAYRPTRYVARYDAGAIETSEGVRDKLASGAIALVDARGAARFRGENETIDPVAGHVPGALNRPFLDNLDAGGRFKPAGVLRDELRAVIGPRDPREVVLMCGSGVTACHDLLAMEHAGLAGARVYAGSWSEWITDPERPVARGD